MFEDHQAYVAYYEDPSKSKVQEDYDFEDKEYYKRRKKTKISEPPEPISVSDADSTCASEGSSLEYLEYNVDELVMNCLILYQ
ncbi:hypothetical protein CEXT_664801 [Caerostris extrusa]|uniref:Uncharacterized protein n=1 Tax=Caerostris extrusa TaxID=172846 RepID=A0AAV4MRG2_CAEEX|nr:hypothetical protein CEXT_664801 [Caerostris extrusa]